MWHLCLRAGGRGRGRGAGRDNYGAIVGTGDPNPDPSTFPLPSSHRPLPFRSCAVTGPPATRSQRYPAQWEGGTPRCLSAKPTQTLRARPASKVGSSWKMELGALLKKRLLQVPSPIGGRGCGLEGEGDIEAELGEYAAKGLDARDAAAALIQQLLASPGNQTHQMQHPCPAQCGQCSRVDEHLNPKM